MLASRKILLIVLALLSSTLWTVHENDVASRAQNVLSQSPFERRESAYRANNIGVAFLEQYKAKEAVESFQQALRIKPDLFLAQINLAIAYYYLPDADAAKRAAEKALMRDANTPQPHYILGLIARTQNRLDDALIEFQKVLNVDPNDVGANVNLGQLLVQAKKSAEAISVFQRALAAEPYNETALYNLGLVLSRTGKREEGQQLLKKFQQFKESGAGTAIGANYLEGGRYAEAVASKGLETGLIDGHIPNVKYLPASSISLPSDFSIKASETENYGKGITEYDRSAKSSREPEAIRRRLAASLGGNITLIDFDGDGDLDLFVATPEEQHLYRNDGGEYSDVTASSGLPLRPPEVSTCAVAGDYDNDGKPDLFVVRYGKLSLYHNDGGGKFSDRSTQSLLPTYNYVAASASLVDVDHDGDLDIFIPGLMDVSKPARYEDGRLEPNLDSPVLAYPGDFATAPNLLLRNNGNGTFVDITAAANLVGGGHAVGVVATDYDNRRDVDLLVLNHDRSPDLFRNNRDGSFSRVTQQTGLDIGGGWTCVAAGDVNKDGFTDFFFGRNTDAGSFMLSDGRGRFVHKRAPFEATRDASAAQFIDYDNDGLLDCVILTNRGLRVLRNMGDTWQDVTKAAVAKRLTDDGASRYAISGRMFVSADLDNDGDVDFIVGGRGGPLTIARNDGGNRNRSVKIELHGRVSNRSAVEAKVEMRAGSLYQKLETYSASPAPAPTDLILGLGKREKPDAVRVIWPAGIVQAETEFPASAGGSAVVSLNITELDRKPSSCPYLYAWNGDRFEFITDFMGGGEMGYLEEPGGAFRATATRKVAQPAVYNKPDPDEYVRITSDQLRANGGRYELRVTNELEEALFVDRLQLLAVAHPAGTEVYPNEGMTTVPKPFRLFVTTDARPPVAVVDEHGHDVIGLVSQLDRRWPDDFDVDRIRGYAQDHSLTLKLGESNKQSPTSKVILLLTGWTDYAWSSDNVAASQSGKAMKPPVLQVKDGAGNWRTVIDDMGIPVGRPQTVTVDLTGKFLSASREVRIVTNMRVYWDRILVTRSDEATPSQFMRLDPVKADLRWRGFSAEVTPDGREPFGYDYQRVSFASPWKTMTGRYTREGDVRELLLNTDDMFAICRPGDEISLSFDATSLPPLPPGWTRTFLLYADGFSKEMDINSASPDQILPLPFHGMSRYPYAWPDHYPADARHLEYLEKYNTRLVTSPVASLAADWLRQ